MFSSISRFSSAKSLQWGVVEIERYTRKFKCLTPFPAPWTIALDRQATPWPCTTCSWCFTWRTTIIASGLAYLWFYRGSWSSPRSSLKAEQSHEMLLRYPWTKLCQEGSWYERLWTTTWHRASCKRMLTTKSRGAGDSCRQTGLGTH